MPDAIVAPVVTPLAEPATPPAPASGAATGSSAPALAHAEVGLFAPLYPLPRLALAQGRGAWVRDTGGREYLDFTSGIAVNAFGHAPSGLAEALTSRMS